MGSKGGKKHLKREMSPKFWPISRKKFSWTVKAKPGPHATFQCMPLIIIVREILGLAKTRKEAKSLISQGKFFVDGKVRRDERFPVGLMDIISIPEINKNFRILPSKKGLFLNPINEDETTFKICRIENKKILNKNVFQLNLHDGRNLIFNTQNSSEPTTNIYKSFDVLKINVHNQEIIEHLKLEKGMQAIFIGGSNEGKHGVITSEEKEFKTRLDYVFIIGDKNPRISLQTKEI
jgi:small subunit ribosomal protein S4e